MVAANTCTLTLRAEPHQKETLRTAGNREYRSIANNVVAVLLRDNREHNDIPIPDQQALSTYNNEEG